MELAVKGEIAFSKLDRGQLGVGRLYLEIPDLVLIRIKNLVFE
jgi:hypothetical protein